MNRKNGTSAPRAPVIVTYRELVPCAELRGYVRAFYSFVPGAPAWCGRRAVIREVQFTIGDSFCSPLFADGHTSLVFDLGATCHLGTGWTFGTPVQARAIGALRRVGAPAASSHAEMVGAYFEPGATSALLHIPAAEITDISVNLEQLWGRTGVRLAEDLAGVDEAARVSRLEAVLIDRVQRAPSPRWRIDVAGLARWVRAEPAGVSVHRLASAAGTSRQHLTRVFREAIGVSPKRYCRLARFHAGLVHARPAIDLNWADIALALGYADQSHMIAEFRELSGLTPDALATGRWFHPFILEARSRGSLPRRNEDP